MSQYVRVGIEALQGFLSAVFERRGFSAPDAGFIAETLIDADRRGIASHGMQRMAMYDHKLRHGMIDPAAQVSVVSDIKACAVLDGHSGMGQLISRDAMKLAITKAQEHGIGVVSVRDSNHFGTAGYWARMAANQGLIGVAMTNSNPLTAPTHAGLPALGSNPIAFAVGQGDDQFVYDAATSTVSLGKIEVLVKLGEPIAGDWAVDEHGAAEHDSARMMGKISASPRIGGLTPLGGSGEMNAGYKGYGLNMIVEILTGILSGGVLSWDMKGQHICHCFAAIDLEAFGGAQLIGERVAELSARLRALPSVDGHPVLVAGDKEREAAQNNEDSIPVDAATFRQLITIGERANVSVPQTWHSNQYEGPAQ
ncbi:Ldh family oxidoreductase [Bifidobacterium cebidarum]|uniref:Malate/L-lactate dehydrogenase n=1 Tax=Bifidobacterium cebidarum TaxID=2650773 RepID=A0A6I1GCU4_9BIFI|nr:Ldh family oxidoreductase [Bifidobacterium cebidarum]KAB7786523.1 malate/L-lactate dehydrogenase [Bifidobacterium cebidarum]